MKGQRCKTINTQVKKTHQGKPIKLWQTLVENTPHPGQMLLIHKLHSNCKYTQVYLLTFFFLTRCFSWKQWSIITPQFLAVNITHKRAHSLVLQLSFPLWHSTRSPTPHLKKVTPQSQLDINWFRLSSGRMEIAIDKQKLLNEGHGERSTFHNWLLSLVSCNCIVSLYFYLEIVLLAHYQVAIVGFW